MKLASEIVAVLAVTGVILLIFLFLIQTPTVDRIWLWETVRIVLLCAGSVGCTFGLIWLEEVYHGEDSRDWSLWYIGSLMAGAMEAFFTGLVVVIMVIVWAIRGTGWLVDRVNEVASRSELPSVSTEGVVALVVVSLGGVGYGLYKAASAEDDE